MRIAVLDKAFSILEVLARIGRALSLAELAEESRLPKPTVLRILRSLRSLGYVEAGEQRGSCVLPARRALLREQGRDARLSGFPHATEVFDQGLGVEPGVAETTQSVGGGRIAQLGHR